MDPDIVLYGFFARSSLHVGIEQEKLALAIQFPDWEQPSLYFLAFDAGEFRPSDDRGGSVYPH